MATVLFFTIPATGHLNPTGELVRQLVLEGENIIYILTEDYREYVESLGANFVAYPDIIELRMISHLSSSGNIPQNANTLVKIGEQLLPFIFKILDEYQPDYVIYDSLCSWAKMALQRYTHIPTVAIFATFTIYPFAPPPLPPHQILKTMRQLMGQLRSYWLTRRKIKQQYQIKSVGLMEAVMCQGDLNIVCTSKEFQPDGQRFDSSYVFVGPMLSKQDKVINFPYDFLETDTVIYISLGTINNHNIKFYQMCIEAFGEMDVHVVMSVGKQINIDDIGEIPSNFIVRDYVPQLKILEYVTVFITHGGLNSVHESLLAGVPMIVVPQQIEQNIVAKQVEKFGAGKMLLDPDVESLKVNFELILGDTRFLNSAISLGGKLANQGGIHYAISKIKDFVN